MKRSISWAGGAVAGVAALALAVPQIAGAEESPSPATVSSADSAPESGADDRPTADERRQELAGRLAEELGLDTTEVSAAMETVLGELRSEHEAERAAGLSARLDEAVDSGRLTRAQADAVLEAARQGELVGPDGGHLGPGGPLGGPLGGAPDEGGTDEGGTDS